MTAVQGKDGQVGDVGRQVERADEHRAEQEGARHGPRRVAHLGGGEGDVRPGVGREERADHRRAELGQRAPQAVLARERQHAEVGSARRRAAEGEPEDDDRRQGAHLGDGEHGLHEPALIQTAGVEGGEREHDQHRAGLNGTHAERPDRDEPDGR